jgi:hypothetical protein
MRTGARTGVTPTAATGAARRDSAAPDGSNLDWVLLPGLFSWDEVCALFSADAGRSDGWRFSVRRASPDGLPHPLYTVLAAPPSRKRMEE